MIPTTIEAGVTLDFETTVTDYPPADGWELRFYLRGPGSIDLTATASGSGYRVQATAVTTRDWVPGDYTWKARVSNGAGVVVPVGEGRITIAPNIAAQSAGFDGRTQAEKALADAEAALAAWTPTHKQFQVGGRTVMFNSTADIIKAINYWRAKVAAEEVMSGRRTELGRRIYSRI